jgi:protein-S-isoprenylcysteine O-methyltransferase Ste14
MWSVIRHALAILALPFTMAVLVPLWIARTTHARLESPGTVAGFAMVCLGVTCAAAGIWLFVWSVFYFATRGRGTLAPWDPPRHLVVEGPYRFVRNPMISGVIFILLAEALILRSRPHAGWAALFTLINAIYIPLLEEPDLHARFGLPYQQYRGAVRRFIPRLTPWKQPPPAT